MDSAYAFRDASLLGRRRSLYPLSPFFRKREVQDVLDRAAPGEDSLDTGRFVRDPGFSRSTLAQGANDHAPRARIVEGRSVIGARNVEPHSDDNRRTVERRCAYGIERRVDAGLDWCRIEGRLQRDARDLPAVRERDLRVPVARKVASALRGLESSCLEPLCRGAAIERRPSRPLCLFLVVRPRVCRGADWVGCRTRERK